MARETTSMAPRHLFGGAITMDLPVLYGDARWVLTGQSVVYRAEAPGCGPAFRPE
jgi:hypothetical protein